VRALAAAPLLTGLGVRRRRYRTAARATHASAATAEAAWTDLRERAGNLGHPVPASATPRQSEALLLTVLPDVGRGALHRLARAVEQARYAPAPADDGAGLRDDVGTVTGALAGTVARGARWRARLLPASGLTHLRRVGVDLGLAVDAFERRFAGRLRRVASSWRRVAPQR